MLFRSDSALHRQPRPAGPPALDLARHVAWQSGVYSLHFASDETRQIDVVLPPPQVIEGSWDVAFDSAWGGPARTTFNELLDWSSHPDPRIRFYSGAAVYTKIFDFALPAHDIRTWLDLGRVAVIGMVIVNGKDLGIVWSAPHRVDVTGALLNGQNTLEIRVINCWSNRLIGDEHVPQDSDRISDGVIRNWPQ